MTRRRVKSRRFQGKMAKLKSAISGDLSQLGAKMRRPLAMSLLILVTIAEIGGHFALPAAQSQRNSKWNGSDNNREVRTTSKSDSSSLPIPSRHARKFTSANSQEDKDPMEPCYLANNRASETLTISESTPVGTVVGEIMVIGDLENIELSIRMPAGSGLSQAIDDPELVSAASTSNFHLDQSQTGVANGHYSAQSRAVPLKGSGPLRNSSSSLAQLDAAATKSNNGIGIRKRSKPKGVRDLSEKIDLMPPLSLEQGTKRLILAKKLDRENLEKYMQSLAGSSLTQSSSASLTVHVKCQLKMRQVNHNSSQTISDQRLMINGSEPNLQPDLDVNLSSTISAKDQDKHRDSKATTANSILIPVHLIITDENDNWPIFSTGPYIIDLNETASVGSLLQNNEILAFDYDQPGPLSTIEYSIVQGSFWSDSFGFLNPLDSRSLIVKDNRRLDYESQPKIMLNIMARDQGDPPNWAITTLYVNLIDQDDMNPVFNQDKYQGSIRENRPGERIDLAPRRMIAYDGDKMLSAPISYSFFMKTNESMHFDLDSESGQLTLKKSFMVPNLTSGTDSASFCLLIKATQLDNPQRWSMTAVTIGWECQTSLSSSNMRYATESRSKTSGFDLANHTIDVSESSPVGTTIFIAQANFKLGEISYQLLDNELGYLDIDQNSGRLSLKKSLDYEMFRQLSVRILATAKIFDQQENNDRGDSYPGLGCDIIRLNINVVNCNDYSPEFSHDLYNFQLSISDLIANFERDSNSLDQNRLPPKISPENLTSIKVLQQEDKISGQAISADETIDELGHRAILLGQIYCADRDYGDRILFQLTGSRASLFHLAQDGRLYLPLSNLTSEPGFANPNLLRRHFSGDRPNQNDITDSHATLSRVFPISRRGDEHHRDGKLDRAYLNYLLSELGNMGLLRLKVHASDNGQPESKRSTALIVISIISIDNFIIQRSPTLKPIHGDSDYGLGKSRGDTSHGSGSNQNDSTVDGLQDESSGHEGETMPTMMIPSMNGRSFVHINPDIVGNLLSTNSHLSTALHPSTRAENSNSLNGSSHSSQFDPLEPLSSNAVTDILNHRETRLNHVDLMNESKYKPPSLLLVDEDGAKFVAMPTAMEVYNQHVKEANGYQKMKAKLKQPLGDSESKGKKSSWYPFSDKLGMKDEGSIMQWINISTAIVLHLIVIACILSLAVRFKLLFGFNRGYRSSNESSSDSNFMDSQPDLISDHNLSSFNRWPKNISNFGSFLVEKQSEPATSDKSITDYSPTDAVNSINQCSTFNHQESFHDNGLGGHVSVHPGKENPTSKQPSTSIVSSGVLVSVKSRGQFAAKHHSGNDMSDLSPEAKCHQQNLFEHLKLTLDKIIDSDNVDRNDTAKVGVRSIGPESEDSSQRDHQLDICAQLDEASEFKIETSKKSPVEKSAISTFVGKSANHLNTTNQKGLSSARTKESNLSQSIVSINVLGPKAYSAQQRILSSKNELETKNSTSSNSSIVSLVSMSSSTLSNKINAAAGKIGNNGSDSTSLNSSILLQTRDGVACGDSNSSSIKEKCLRKVTTKQPPAPPPLPPPPSLIRAIALDKLEDVFTNIATPAGKLNKLALSHDSKTKLTNAERSGDAHVSRQVQPKNPAHLRLRRDDQLLSPSNNRIEQNPSDECSMAMNCCREVDLASQTHRANLSVGGRREARTGHQHQRYSQRLRGSVAKPLKQEDINHGKQSTSPLNSSSNKTISPTTSVDRGYESFQSFGMQPIGVHFASLPDYPQVCNNYECDEDVTYMSESNAGRRGSRPIGKKPLDNRISRKSMKSNVSKTASGLTLQSVSANSRTRYNTTKGQFTGLLRSSTAGDGMTNDSHRDRANRLDCDTEDDDFYYYCSESVQDDEHHQVGCLSYSNHAYQQQIYQTDLSTSKSLNAERPIDHSSRRATRTSRSGNSGGRKINLYKSDLSGQSSNQFGVTTSQICDMMACEGRRGFPPGRSQQISDGQSSQIGGEVGVKRLTWSDQVY